MNYSYLINLDINNAINSKGDAVHELISQNTPLITAKMTQATTAAPSVATLIDINYPSTTTLTFARTSAGLYTLTASTAIFGASAAKLYSEPLVYVDTAGALTVLTITWTSSTVLTFTATTNAGVAKDAKVTALPFRVWVYPA
jgi:hypothetical protein